MTLSDSNINDRDDDWLAMRFVLGELDADDADRFETRLADDQELRDAVVRATQLVQTLALTGDHDAVVSPAPQKRPRKVRTLVAALVSVAAAVVVGVVAWRNVPPDVPHPMAADPIDVDPARLVVLWTESSESLNGVGDSDETDDAGSIDAHSSLLPPDWMLAAVEYESVMGDSLDEQDIERN